MREAFLCPNLPTCTHWSRTACKPLAAHSLCFPISSTSCRSVHQNKPVLEFQLQGNKQKMAQDITGKDIFLEISFIFSQWQVTCCNSSNRWVGLWRVFPFLCQSNSKPGHPRPALGMISPQEMWSGGLQSCTLVSQAGFQCMLSSCKGKLDWLCIWSTQLMHSSCFYA